ncbi:MAG: FKBP-type peptidyl-prolyl cis-trans isomerase, partial [Pirellulales bacterium]
MSTGPTVSALVRTYDLSSGAPVVLNSISPFDTDFEGGVSITTGRYDADSIPELVVTAGRKGNAATKVISTKGGTTSTLVELSGDTLAEGASVQSLRTPRIALADDNGDGRFDALLASQGSPDVNGNALVSRFTLDESGVTRDQSSALAAAFSSLGSSLVSVPLQVGNPVYTTTSTGLRYRDIQVGAGNQPASSSDSVTVNYEGWLLDGTRFDGNDNITFNLNGVIAGWTEGLSTMREGGIRILIIPPDLGYGNSGTGSIPGGSTLVFRVELLGINGSVYRPPILPS